MFTSASASKNLWHDLLRFNYMWGTPTFETYTGSWASDTLNTAVFSGNQFNNIAIVDGTTKTAARWTWNNSNIAFSYSQWWLIGFAYAGVTTPAHTVLIESSADGSSWTTRTNVSGVAANGDPGPVLFWQPYHSGHTYMRLTITSTNGVSINLAAIQAMSPRWGNQGGGAEYELPYAWDINRRITLNATGLPVARSNGVLNIGGTSPSTAAEGIYFGTDTNLYRSAADTLKTDDTLIVGTAGTAAGSVATIDGTQTLTAKTLTNPRMNQINDTNGNQILGLIAVASAVNRFQLNNQATGGTPVLQVVGSDTDVSMSLRAAGAGKIRIQDGANTSKVVTLDVTGVTATRNWAWPDASDTYVGLTTTQTITNKTISGSSNTLSNIAISSLSITGTPDGTKFLRDDGSWQTVAGGGGGDASTNTSSSVDSEIALFSGTGGKTLKRMTGSGIVKVTSGVASTATGGTDYVAPGGALGTPSSGTLTNCTGLPVSGITASTSTALGVGSIELGHASDTTVSRAAAGRLAVEGVNVVTISSTDTLTNKTITSGKFNQLLDTNGVGIFELTPTASAVNRWGTYNAATGNAPGLYVVGDTNRDGLIVAAGTGSIQIPALKTQVIKETRVPLGTKTTTATVDASQGSIFTITLTASTACAVTVTNLAADQTIEIRFTQASGAGGGTFSISGVSWDYSGAPVMTPVAGKVDRVFLTSDGTTVFGAYNQGY
jgi:hypothetical protein